MLTGIQALFGSAGAFQRMNDDQKVALKGITDGLDIFIGRLKGIAGAISGFFGGGGPGAAAPLPYGHPMHPSGLGPQSPLYPHQSQADTPVHIKTAVYLDGRIIGETISSELAHRFRLSRDRLRLATPILYGPRLTTISGQGEIEAAHAA